MENWYEETRKKTENIFQEIIKHDFVKELMGATLDKDTFGFYVNQDSLYLSEYKKHLLVLEVSVVKLRIHSSFMRQLLVLFK